MLTIIPYLYFFNHQVLLSLLCFWTEGCWHQRADEWHGKPPQGNQELLVQPKTPPGEFGVNKSIGCDIFPSVL